MTARQPSQPGGQWLDGIGSLNQEQPALRAEFGHHPVDTLRKLGVGKGHPIVGDDGGVIAEAA